MKRSFQTALVLAGCLLTAPQFHAQTPAGKDAAGTDQSKTADKAPKGEAQKQAEPQSSTNPFPTDINSVPVLPSNPAALAGAIRGEAGSERIPLPDGDLDPARSPEDAAAAGDSGAAQGYSSSASGELPPLDETEPKRKGKKNEEDIVPQMPRETAKDDINVGTYYLDNGNWQGALSRFQSALVLDPEEPDIYWGLAECERHLGDYAAARAHYLKVIEYDPGSRRAKDARKALRQPEMENAQGPAQSQAPSGKP